MSTNSQDTQNHQLSVIDVTPELAARWLAEANSNNRAIRNRHVDNLASEMMAGNWRHTHEGIAFDEDGVLLDGQHRLAAVCKYGKPVRMNVWSGISRAARMVVDSGAARSVADRVTLDGRFGKVTRGDVATLRSMLHRNAIASAEVVAVELDRHQEAIAFATRILGETPKVATSDVRGAVARAWYWLDPEVLAEFAYILRYGLPLQDWVTSKQQRTAVMARDYLLACKGLHQMVRRERYLKTERALVAFSNNESLQRLQAPSGELFPFPGEVDKAEP